MTIKLWLLFDCVEGAGPCGGICGQAGWQSSGVELSGASPQRHRESDELRQPPAGAGLPPPSCRYLQVTAPFDQNTFVSLDMDFHTRLRDDLSLNEMSAN